MITLNNRMKTSQRLIDLMMASSKYINTPVLEVKHLAFSHETLVYRKNKNNYAAYLKEMDALYMQYNEGKHKRTWFDVFITYSQAKEKIHKLVKAGYNVPDYVAKFHVITQKLASADMYSDIMCIDNLLTDFTAEITSYIPVSSTKRIRLQEDVE